MEQISASAMSSVLLLVMSLGISGSLIWLSLIGLYYPKIVGNRIKAVGGNTAQ
jgi:hypothetical protein